MMIVQGPFTFLLSLIFFGNSLRKVQANSCRREDRVTVYFDFELFVISAATICTPQQEVLTSALLKKVLQNEALKNIPQLISSNTYLCAKPSTQRRRTLLQIEGNQTFHDVINAKEEKLPSLGITDSLASNEWDDVSFSHRRGLLRNMFIYRGGLRCKFCDRDDRDSRRRHLQQCRHRMHVVYEGFNSRSQVESWTNGKLLTHGSKKLVTPKTTNQAISKRFFFPTGMFLLTMSFEVFTDALGATWGNGDSILFEVRWRSMTLRPPRSKNDRKIYKHKVFGFSYAYQHRWKNNKLQSTFVKIYVYEGMLWLSDIDLIATVQTSSSAKKAGIGSIHVATARICSSGDTLDQGTTWSERWLETSINEKLTGLFQKEVAKQRNYCFKGADPSVYINLYERESLQDIKPTCNRLV